MADPEDQTQHFNAIIMWLSELHVTLCRYIISTDVNPWFTFDVEKAIIEKILHIEFGTDERLPRTEQDIRNYDGKITTWCPRGCI
jgi:hypothetical protein